MVGLPYQKVLGARVRSLREERGWSQSTIARQVPLSQKQWSRLELGDVSFIDRDLLIRLAEIFAVPIATGELNQWLHAFGYRPHIVPLLPIPPNHRELLAHYLRYPAIIIDFGRYLRYANDQMVNLYALKVERLVGIQRNWLWHYFHPEGILYHTYPQDSIERILNRLFWDWQPYYNEPWNQSLRLELEEALNIRWTELAARYHIPNEPLAGAVSETITISARDGSALVFQNQTVNIAARPDLYTIVYHPLNDAALNWHHQALQQDQA